MSTEDKSDDQAAFESVPVLVVGSSDVRVYRATVSASGYLAQEHRHQALQAAIKDGLVGNLFTYDPVEVRALFRIAKTAAEEQKLFAEMLAWCEAVQAGHPLPPHTTT